MEIDSLTTGADGWRAKVEREREEYEQQAAEAAAPHPDYGAIVGYLCGLIIVQMLT